MPTESEIRAFWRGVCAERARVADGMAEEAFAQADDNQALGAECGVNGQIRESYARRYAAYYAAGCAYEHEAQVYRAWAEEP